MKQRYAITILGLAAAFLLLSAVQVFAQARMGMGGQRAAGATWGVPGVTLTAEQQQRVNTIRQETQSKVQAIRIDPNLTADAKAELIAGIQQSQHERVMNVLTAQQRQQFEAQQQARLQAGAAGLGQGPCGAGLAQGRRGGAGPGMGQGRGAGQGMRGRGMGNPGFGGGLGYGLTGQVPGVQLTAEQQQKVITIRQEMQTQAQRIQADPNLTAQQKAEKVAVLRDQTHQRVMQILTPEQRKQYPF